MRDKVIYRVTRRGTRYTATNPVDEETLRGKIIKLAFRPDAAPRAPNPIRRFRDELRLNRQQFADLVGVPLETERSWERPKPVMPKSQTLMRIISLARRNHYPLKIEHVWNFYGQ